MSTPDIHHLKPVQLTMLLNASPLGEVISLPTVYRHRAQVGFRIGDGESIDLLKYTAWLYHERRRLLAQATDERDAYAALKESARQRNAEMSAAGRDIGELSAVADPERRERCRTSFKLFCETYFSGTFSLAWSDDHLKVIRKIEQAVLHGGLFAMAMPRGSGKTSLCEVACIWSILYGAQRFVCLIGSDEGHAEHMLRDIRTDLEHNDLLLADFPEACYPIRCLEGIANRCAGQTYQGQRTLIGWTAKEIVLPTLPDSAASGAVIRVAGLTGGFRGMIVKRADGTSIRPSLVLLDDPQTDESARSPSQCAEREAILAGAVLGLAGPGQNIAGLMTLTVIRPDDMADRILDRQKHPQWQGERTKMVYQFPGNQKLWDEYAQIRADGLRAERGTEEATAFYAAHREAMDAGAVVAWPQRHKESELSALQHAMNLRIDNEQAFWAEYQNEPLVPQQSDDLLTADQICAKTNGLKRGVVRQAAQYLSCFIDVQQDVLFYVVCAWDEHFGGDVIDYGCYPEQQSGYFTLSQVTRKLSAAAPGTGLEGWLFAGLKHLSDRLLSHAWVREDGTVMRIGQCLIDANWGESTDVVKQFCRQSGHAAVLVPSHGRFAGAAGRSFDEYSRKAGDRVGHHWRVPATANGTHRVRHVLYDTNYWKSFVHARLAVATADRGCLSLFESRDHRMFADHLLSEQRIAVTAKGRTVGEWKLKAGGRDNHWFDCLVGCAVGASMLGARLREAEVGPPPPRKRIRYAEAVKHRRVWGAAPASPRLS